MAPREIAMLFAAQSRQGRFPKEEELQQIYALQNRRGFTAAESFFADSACVKYGMESIERIASNYANGPRDHEELAIQDVPVDELDALQMSLEIARPLDEKSHGHAVVFRSVVLETDAENAFLHGDVRLPLRLVLDRRTHLKKWDVITGRAAPNFGKLYAAEGHAWVVLHVLRVHSGFRKQFELRAQEVAERTMGERGLALHAKPRQEVVNTALTRDARGGRHTSAVEQAAGLIIERELEDGKSRFRGVVGVVDAGAEWGVVSANVFLDFSYVRSKWGAVALGDVVYGLMVPQRKGGCDWRCVHVFKVDRNGEECLAADKAIEQRIAAEDDERKAKAEELSKQDHKAEIEKLKEALRERREEERRKREEERDTRRAARRAGAALGEVSSS